MLEGDIKDARKIAAKHGMMQISDKEVIRKLALEVLDTNPQAIETFKQGRDNIVGFLVGQVIKNPKARLTSYS